MSRPDCPALVCPLGGHRGGPLHSGVAYHKVPLRARYPEPSKRDAILRPGATKEARERVRRERLDALLDGLARQDRPIKCGFAALPGTCAA